MFKKRKILIETSILVILILFSIFKILPRQKSVEIPKPPDSPTVGKSNETKKNEIQKKENSVDNTTLEINGTKYETEISGPTNVDALMQKLKDEGKINFKSETYTGMGKFIEEINGVKNDKKNWIYYVNGEKANIGISNYQIKPGDVVSWKYEDSY